MGVKKGRGQQKEQEYDLKPIGNLTTDNEFIEKLGSDVFNAVVCGDVHGVRSLLGPLLEGSRGPEVRNYAPLLAAARNQVQVLRALADTLQLAESLDSQNRSALHYAALSCHAQAVCMLLYEANLSHDEVDVLGYSAFEYASEGGDVDVMDLILDRANGQEEPPPHLLPPPPAPEPPRMMARMRAPMRAQMAPSMMAPSMECMAPAMPQMAPAPMMPEMAMMDCSAVPMAPEGAFAARAAPMPPPAMMAFTDSAPSFGESASRSVVLGPFVGTSEPAENLMEIRVLSGDASEKKRSKMPVVKKSAKEGDAVPKKFFLQSLVLAARKGNTRAVLRLLDEASVVREARAGFGSGRNSLLHLLGRRISAQELSKLSECGLDITSRNTSGVRAFEEVPPVIMQQFLDLSVRSAPESVDAERGVTEAFTVTNPFLNKEHPDLDVSTLIEISNSSVHTQLIFHPLFFGICAIKWRFIRKFFWLVALLAFAFAVTTSWLTVTRVRNFYDSSKTGQLIQQNRTDPKLIEVSDKNILFSQIITSVLLVLLLITEIGNMLLHNLTVYVARYLVVIASLIILLLLIFFFPPEILQQNSYFVIFVPWLFLMYHICQHYSFAQYYSNFIQIAKTSLKIVFVFGSIPIAFALIFHVMLLGQSDTEISSFDYVYTSLLRTIAMMIGDMAMDDFSDQFTSLQWSMTYLIFILGVALVLYNMINALAVSDTHKLNSRAEVFRMIALTRQILTAQGWLRTASRLPLLGMLRVPVVRDFTVECRNYRWSITSFSCEHGGEQKRKELGIANQDDQEVAPKLTIRERTQLVALPCNAKFVKDLQAIATGNRTT